MITKESLIAGTMIILITYTVGLSLVRQASPAAQTIIKISNTGTIETIGDGVYTDVYTDVQHNYSMTSLQWGTLEPGGSQTVTGYIRNEGNSPSTLYMYTSNWNPSNAETYLSLSWDYGGQLIDPGASTQITFKLIVDANIEGITNFSFEITIVGTEVSQNQKPDLLSEPRSWRFLAGSGSSQFPPEITAQHVFELGANGVYIPVFVDCWDNEATLANGCTQTEHRVRYADEIHRLGGIVYMQVLPWSWIKDGSSVLKKRQVINAEVVDGINKQDEYIGWVKNTLGENGHSRLDADIIQILNEVESDNFPDSHYASPQYWSRYIDFANRYMAQIAEVKPDAVFTVSSIPFWNLNIIAEHLDEFIVPEGCRLIYSFHYYYSLRNVYPPDHKEEQRAYWDGNTELGKSLTADYWLSNLGLQALLDLNQTVLFDEQGTNLHNPNYETWIRDTAEFCKKYDLGTCTLCCSQSKDELGVTPANNSPGAFWSNKDFTLNNLGVAWQEANVD